MMDLRKLPEVMPDDADERVAAIYDDVKGCLHVPFVNYLFRVLANDPADLERSWLALRPWVLSRKFEERADRLRRAAAPEEDPEPLDLGARAPESAGRIAAFNATIHGVLPRLLLIATGLAEGVPVGAHPGERIEPGIPDEAESIPMVAVDEAEGRLAELFHDIRERHGHPGVASWYRSLGNWPDLLEEVWSRLSPRVGSEAYVRRREALVDLAAASWRGLDGERHHRVIDDPDLEGVVRSFRDRLIPDLLIDVSYVRAATPVAAGSPPMEG
ncbi:MAG: halocarboxylic acid dehydrogenase DehI family protein [Gemmatimonadetes bacterium]|nr:halocarboxylic acid dehydrogenase DehI family protein [Gemmatimonadota bacterium]